VYIKGNLLTILVSALTVIITIILHIDTLIAFLIWLSAFMLDAFYTYLNREYVREYELNMIVRRSGSIELAFIKVAIIESLMIIGMGMVFESMTSDSGNGGYGSSSIAIGYSLSLILFASIHVMAFVRSYLFIKSKEERKEGKGRKEEGRKEGKG